MVQPVPKLLPSRIDKEEVTNIDDLCRQISEENDRRIEGMLEERIERERIEIVGQFRSGIGDLLRRTKEAREKRDREQVPSMLVGFNSTLDVDKQLRQHKSFQNQYP